MGLTTEHRGRGPKVCVPGTGQFLNSTCIRFRFRFRLILFCQHTTFNNSNVYKKNEIIKYADMEAPIKTISGRYHRANRKINYTDHK